MAKGYPQLTLDPVWRDRILELLREEGDTTHSPQFEDTEEKLLPRIGWLYGTLMHLFALAFNTLITPRRSSTDWTVG
jgi:hypothetical protein